MRSIKRFSLIVLLFILCFCFVALETSKLFSPKLNQCEILQFSYVADQSFDIKACSGRFSVSTKQSVTILSKVVAAAMDIKRNSIKLGSAVQIIGESDIQQTAKPCVLLDRQIL